MTKSQKSGKIRKRIILWLGIPILLIALAATGVKLFLNEEKIQNYIVTELNKHLRTSIEVEEIQFSVFRKFPHASLHFNNARIKEPDIDRPGNLLEADDLFLEFSIIDLIFGKYTIKQIDISNASYEMKVFADGTDNFHFWKVPEDSVSDQDFSFDLQRIRVENVYYSYTNEEYDQEYAFLLRKGKIRGNFTEDNLQLNAEGNILIESIRLKELTIFKGKECETSVGLFINTKTEDYSLSHGKISFGDLELGVQGDMNFQDDPVFDLSFKGNDLDLDDFINQLPEDYRKYFDDYQIDGTFTFDAVLKGVLTTESSPGFQSSFSLSEGSFLLEEEDVSLKNVSCNGNFSCEDVSDQKGYALILNTFKSGFELGFFNASLKMKNFEKPHIDLQTQSELDFNELIRFLKLDTLEDASGKIFLDFSFNGFIHEYPDITPLDLIKSKTTGTLKLENISFRFKESPLLYHDINGKMNFNQNDVLIDQLGGYVEENDFSLQGKFINLIPFLLIDKQSLKVQSVFRSKKIDLGDLLRTSEEESTDTSRYELHLPENIELDLDLHIASLFFGKFEAGDVKGRMQLSNKQILAENISLKTMGGKISGRGMIDGRNENRLKIHCESDMHALNISKMFYQLNNFDQTSLTNKNLKGKIYAKISFSSIWNQYLEPDMDYLNANIKLRLENGELMAYSPIEGLSKYLKGRDLSHIHFKKLENTIEIKNKMIFLPSMTIESDVLNFDISGKHSFDNEIEYHLAVTISDIKKPKNQEPDEFGPILEDGLHKAKYFFLITGTVDNPIYKVFDTKAYKENFRKKVNAEIKNLKELFKKKPGEGKENLEGVEDPENVNWVIEEFDAEETEKVKPQDTVKTKVTKENKETPWKVEWDEEEFAH